MLADIVISGWDWTVFVLAILVALAIDLGVFHRKAHEVRFGEALGWSTLWFVLAISFGLVIAPHMAGNWGRVARDEFITGYIIELALSMDNVFVIALIFSYFGVPLKYQHRVLFWGILGAFLVVTGIRMVFAASDEKVEPEKNIFIRLTRRFFPITHEYHGAHFIIHEGGKWVLTPMALVLVMVETTDLIFAIDSIPAIFGVTTNPFIVFTSNVFAIMGLRSLYFVLAGAIGFFRYLKVGLSIVLCFIGAKMLIAHWHEISTTLSLLIVGTIIITSILISLVAAKRGDANKEVR